MRFLFEEDKKEQPDPALKGVKGKNCNVIHCQSPEAWWYNKPMRAYYCKHCAVRINRSSNQSGMGDICFPEYPEEHRLYSRHQIEKEE